jgi:hypothetical protein
VVLDIDTPTGQEQVPAQINIHNYKRTKNNNKNNREIAVSWKE